VGGGLGPQQAIEAASPLRRPRRPKPQAKEREQMDNNQPAESADPPLKSSEPPVPAESPKPAEAPEAPESSESPKPAEPPVRLSRWSRVALLGMVLVAAVVTAVQCAAVMLVSAPPTTISLRYAPQLHTWTQPFLEQDWQLFGPNPQSSNTRILVRTRSANGVVGSWIDLTAVDYSAIEHDPMPSQVNQNLLRRAWDSYQNYSPTSTLGALTRQYLVNIASQRLASLGDSANFAAIELQIQDAPISSPGSTLTPRSSVAYLPWWTVADKNGGAQ
jgi:hypothetical protein